MTRRHSLPENIVAVVSDVDGTLVRNDKSVSAEIGRGCQDVAGRGREIRHRQQPAAARAEGNHFAPATSRCLLPASTEAIIASPDLSVITSHLIAADVARHAVEAIEASGANAWVFSGDDWFVRDRDGPRVALEERTVGFGPTVVTDFAAVDRHRRKDRRGERRFRAADKIAGRGSRARFPVGPISFARRHTISISPIRSPTRARP